MGMAYLRACIRVVASIGIGSAMNLRVPHPLRSLQRVGYANVGIEIRGSHPSQRTRRTPDFPLRSPIHGRLCGFLRGKPHTWMLVSAAWQKIRVRSGRDDKERICFYLCVG